MIFKGAVVSCTIFTQGKLKDVPSKTNIISYKLPDFCIIG